jgi:hypothetical protein
MTSNHMSPDRRSERFSLRLAAALTACVMSVVVPLVQRGAVAASSPGGAQSPKIVYYSGQAGGLMVMNTDGSSPQPYLPDVPNAMAADFSANGGKVVYQIGPSPQCVEGNGFGSIVVANADGSDPVTVGQGCDPASRPTAPGWRSSLLLQHRVATS